MLKETVVRKFGHKKMIQFYIHCCALRFTSGFVYRFKVFSSNVSFIVRGPFYGGSNILHFPLIVFRASSGLW